tara:strand:- start:599 stop:859 length:261 start_codon:yes stop_codon:yes gene_type:complete
MSSSKLQQILELYPDDTFVIADGLDDAIIGVDDNNLKIVYDIDEVINILIINGMDVDEAIEHYEYNIAGSYVGENTPSFIRLITEL